MSGVQILYSVSEVMLSKSFNLNCSTRVSFRNQFLYREQCIEHACKYSKHKFLYEVLPNPIVV